MVYKFKAPAYPQELTNRWWQSKKGTIAKLSTGSDGTGIGKKLDELKKQFDRINWAPIDVVQSMDGHGGNRTEADLKKGFEDAKKAAGAIQPVSKLADDVAKDAQKLAAEWQRSKVIPKSSTAAAATVAKAAEQLRFTLSLKALSDVVQAGLDEERRMGKQNREVLQKATASFPGKLDGLIADLDGNKATVEGWPHFWSQNIRFTGTQLPKIRTLYPAVQNEIEAFRKASDHQQKPGSEKELDAWVKELSRTAKALRAKLPS